jgi:signal transduction histidine kinase
MAALLHEDLPQHLAGAKFHLSLLSRQVRNDPSQQAIIGEVDRMLKEAMEKSCRLSYDLSPAVLHQNDLAEALRWLAHQMRAQHGLTVRLDAAEEMTLKSEALTIFLFRWMRLLYNDRARRGP